LAERTVIIILPERYSSGMQVINRGEIARP
jgi:hypothetical protein